MASTIQNETIRVRNLVGVETIRGTKATIDHPWYGTLSGHPTRTLIRDPEFRGGYDGYINPARGPWVYDGYTYAEPKLSYEQLAVLLRHGVATAPTPTDDGNTVHGYTYVYRPGNGMFDSFSMEHGVNGLPFVLLGGQFDEFTIGHNADDAAGNWTWGSNVILTDDSMMDLVVAETAATGGSTSTVVKTGAGWVVNAYAGLFVAMRSGTAANIDEVREIASNSATTLTLVTGQTFPSTVANTDTFEIMAGFTAGVTDRTLDYIQNPGTQLIIADDLAGLADAENEVTDKMISFSYTHRNALRSKRFSDNLTGVSTKRGRGMREVTLQITMEWDDWKEYKLFEAAYPIDRAVRVQQLNGPVIDSGAGTKKAAIITLPSAQWDDIDPQQEREGNITATYQALAYLDSGAGYVSEISAKTTLSALP